MAMKVCQLCAVDFTLEKFLLPLIDAMREEGWDVIAVCSDGPYVRALRSAGYRVETLPISRSVNPLLHLKSLWGLIRFFRRERFDVLHAHTPVAALLGRIAARLAGIPLVIYTAHGFYFHDEMPPLKHRFFVWLERLGGKLTDFLFSQSAEDAEAAQRLGIAAQGQIMAIGNGVSVVRFDPTQQHPAKIRDELGIPPDAVVVGIIGRLVREKGYGEFFRAAEILAAQHPNTYFLVVGERLQSDHAIGIGLPLAHAQQLLGPRLVLTGMREDVPALLAAMDIFCLPSYREGMPRTIIEAMMMGKPVVATDIRGSREEVVDGVSGLLAPTRDATALARALGRLIHDPALCASMGRAGRDRAIALYDEQRILTLQIEKIRQLSQKAASTMVLKVCQLCAVDFTLQKFLLPLIDGMRDTCWEVTAVCSDGPFVAGMRGQGYRIETIPIARSMNPISGLRSLRSLIRLFRKEKFDVLHVHTPVAALLGRVAAKFAGVPLVIHTAHGFYFHDEMPAFKRYMFIALEWAAGRITDYLFTVSAEDAETAKSCGIMPSSRILATGNGVNVSRFDPARIDRSAVRKQLGIPVKAHVVGIVSRLVTEKGYVEFFRAAEWLIKHHANIFFLVVGERLQSDHAKAIDDLIKHAQQQLGGKLLLAGMREDVPEMLAAMDIYCLPSYREGLPTTVIEAMLMAKPVVATKIRGSREAVVDGQTGLLVPTRDAGALGHAIARLLEDAGLRASMGRAGRERARALYDEKRIVAMQVEKIRELANEKIMKSQMKCGIRV